MTWFGQPYDLLLGRKTWEIFAAHWPFISDPNDAFAGDVQPHHQVRRLALRTEARLEEQPVAGQGHRRGAEEAEG